MPLNKNSSTNLYHSYKDSRYKLVFEVTNLIQGQIRLSASIYLAATLYIKVLNLLT